MTDNANTWIIGGISTPRLTWGEVRAGKSHQCRICGVILLTGERPGFCCEKGTRDGEVQPLPPLPVEYNTFINHPSLSSLSRVLNLIFSFASLETTHPFPEINGPPGFVAIQGKVYHRVRPTHQNSTVRWLLYDGFMDGFAPHTNWADIIPAPWLNSVRSALFRINPFVAGLRSLNQIGAPDVSLVLEDTGTAEIAAVMAYDNTTQAQIKACRLVISRQNGSNQKISTVSRFWEPLAYPLLFPHGTLGWGVIGTGTDVRWDAPQDVGVDAPTTQMWHYRARILREPRFQIFGRLANEYLVDMFSRDLESRLNFIRANQPRIRKEDAALMGVEEINSTENVYLPSSFLGSRRWATEQIADSLAIAAVYGGPTFFITMTCNPEWPEIQSQLRPGQDFTDIPVVVVRVFKRKLALLQKALKKMFPNTGRQLYSIHSIEFQKRGLPHAHILVKFFRDCVNPRDIDIIVSAEIPTNAEDASLVKRFMMHNHPAPDKPRSKYCQREEPDGSRSCRFRYPHPLQEVTTVDTEGRVHYRRRRPGDEMVVPYCLPLLRKYQCHLNFEVANTSHIFQYLFKYIKKGPDHTRYKVQDPDTEETVDEIEDYWNARYLSAGEAAWRILGFHVSKKDPGVTALPIHLPGAAGHRQYTAAGTVGSSLSLLDRYFLRPLGTFMDGNMVRSFRSLTYTEYYGRFRLASWTATDVGKPGVFNEQANDRNAPSMHVILRSLQHPHVSRIQSVRPSEGDVFYLRAILQNHAAESFEMARTVGDTMFSNYQGAATHLGLFAGQNEAIYAIVEAVQTLRTPRQIRVLFVHLLVNDCVSTPRMIWDEYAEEMSRDFILRHNAVREIGINGALEELGRYLEEYGKTLTDYGLPEPTVLTREVEHELERWSGNGEVLRARAESGRLMLKEGQRAVYDAIMDAVVNREPLCAFVDGKAGRGKTTLVNVICDQVRSMARIAIPTATAAFAAQLYPGGRTTHSAFKVPVNERSEMLESPIKCGDSRAELIKEAAIIIWDEAPMANRAVLTCVEEPCRRVMENNLPFGGKIMLLLGDFRQTCPVIRGGTRAQVVDASIKSSALWPLFTIYRLTEPIRNADDLGLADFVDAIGDGAGPNVDLDMLEKVQSEDDMIKFVYPDNTLQNPMACLKRAILAPTNRQVDAYNDTILEQLGETDERTYLAADTLKEVEEAGLVSPDSILDYVAKHTPPGLAAHSLTVKVGGVYRLLRNFSLDRGLVKNVRVVVVHVGTRIVTVRLLRGMAGVTSIDPEDVLIPRIIFTAELGTGHTLIRRQFPLALAYATMFNSCQGLTLDRVGVDLTRPVFSHGQLYTALSRIRKREDARVRLPPGEEETINVTYSEILV